MSVDGVQRDPGGQRIACVVGWKGGRLISHHLVNNSLVWHNIQWDGFNSASPHLNSYHVCEKGFEMERWPFAGYGDLSGALH